MNEIYLYGKTRIFSFDKFASLIMLVIFFAMNLAASRASYQSLDFFKGVW